MEEIMGNTMFASVPTADGRWLSVRVRASGHSAGLISGSFETKAQTDANARRDMGLPQ